MGQPASTPRTPTSPGAQRSRWAFAAVGVVVLIGLGIVGVRLAGGEDPGGGTPSEDTTDDPVGPSGDAEDGRERSAVDDTAEDRDGVEDPTSEDEPDGTGGAVPEATDELRPSQPGSTTDVGTATEDAARTLERFLALTDAAYEDPDASPALEGIAIGSAASEVHSTIAEFRAVGYRQVGQVAIDEVSLLGSDLEAQPPSLTLATCIDATQVAIVDTDGQRVRAPSREARHLHHYGLVFEDGRWQVTRHEFPDDADC